MCSLHGGIATTSCLPCVQIGDWGREGGQNQTAVAEAMARKADSFHPEFVISVGDNFYESELLPWKTAFDPYPGFCLIERRVKDLKKKEGCVQTSALHLQQ